MIKDDDFIKYPDIPGPTKEEVRCLVLCKLQVESGDVVADIGCGTGGLTVEFSKRAGKVFAVDKNPEALKVTHLNLEKHGDPEKVDLIEGSAPHVLDELPDLDILMVGGSSGELPRILQEGYRKLKGNGRIVVTSILLETRVEAVNTLKELGLTPDVVDVSISKGRVLERGTLMTAQNPITIISTRKN